MGKYIEVISQIKPINNLNFPLADVNDLKGGYIQLETLAEREEINSEKLRPGMLCFILENKKIYQYLDNTWSEFKVSSNNTIINTGGGGVSVVETADDLENIETVGAVAYIIDEDKLVFFNGTLWSPTNRIYIQDKEPEDKNGIWIDTSVNNITTENEVINSLLKTVSILQREVERLNFLINDQLDFGKVTKTKEYLTGEGISPFNNEGLEPEDNLTAGALCMKRGTYAELYSKKDLILHGELVYCYDIDALFTKNPLTDELVMLGTGSGELPDVPNLPNTPTDEEMEGILTEILGGKTKIVGIEMSDISGKNSFKLSVDEEGLKVRNTKLDTNLLAAMNQTAGTSGYYKSLYFPIDKTYANSGNPQIYINSVYCGDENDSLSYCPVSHNFIELANLTTKDLNLCGLFLHYTNNSSGDWVTLPLTGTIKSGSTFLIRGSQCSVEQVNTTKIHVEEPDLYWTKESTYNATVLDIDGDAEQGIKSSTIWGNDGLIKLSTNCSLFLSGQPSGVNFAQDGFSSTAPYNNAEVILGYVDLVGFGKFDGKAAPAELAAYPTVGKNYLQCRYYNLDPVSQATKALSARNNENDWTAVDLINDPIAVKYSPKASKSNKTIFFNKELLIAGAPNIVTCTFGYDAHKTRCFTWVSVGYYDEFLQYWKIEDEGAVTTIESFKEGDERSSEKNWDNPIYNRIRSITTDGTAFTVHKLIVDFPELENKNEQVYCYRVGREGAWTNTKQFTLRNRSYVTNKGVRFLQFSDQQGFTTEEYEMMRLCNEVINNDKENSFDFVINVGDATQNGNRINEWVDYFKNGEMIFDNKEQMFSIGNNDLCPVNAYELGRGADADKTNPINATYFFTFEHPYEIPTSAAGIYIPCTYDFIIGDTYFLSINSEITDTARKELYGDGDGTNVYSNLETWCKRSAERINKNNSINWRVAFCHEAPFTILTAQLMVDYYNEGKINNSQKRGGSHLNTVGSYFFSKFLQDYDFKLCLCGHKHTYSNSRLIHDDIEDTMRPFVYEPLGEEAEWYKVLPDMSKACVRISTNKEKGWVKYAMTQACGYKLVSNKELPAQNIPWLLGYYPVSSQKVESGTAKVECNNDQKFPNYIVWDIGEGSEVENKNARTNIRRRIIGKSFKIQQKANTDGTWPAWKYLTPVSLNNLEIVGGNGSYNTATGSWAQSTDNIIVEHTL